MRVESTLIGTHVWVRISAQEESRRLMGSTVCAARVFEPVLLTSVEAAPRSTEAVVSSSTARHGPTPFMPARLVSCESKRMMSCVPALLKKTSMRAGGCKPMKLKCGRPEVSAVAVVDMIEVRLMNVAALRAIETGLLPSPHVVLQMT